MAHDPTPTSSSPQTGTQPSDGCVCGNRSPHPTAPCRITEDYRQVVIRSATARNVDTVAALDLWAHARKRLDAVSAARVVTDIIDLGWRPVIGFRGGEVTQ